MSSFGLKLSMSTQKQQTNVLAQGSQMQPTNKPTIRPIRPLKPLDIFTELRIKEALEQLIARRDSFVYFGDKPATYQSPPIELDDGIQLTLVITTEYDQKIGNLKSKNSKDKRRRREQVSNYFIQEEIKRCEEIDRLIQEECARCNEIEKWRQATKQQIEFWTPQRIVAVPTDMRLVLLWNRWLNWVPPPPEKMHLN